ncbi:MAG: amidase [Gemmatimonadales bacterium]|jgi:amidase
MHQGDLSRRGFLGMGLAGGVLTAADLTWPTRRAAARISARPPGPAAFELEEMTVAQLQDGMRSGRWTARALAEQYLARIDELDQRGPALHTIIELNPDALAIAAQLDAERGSKGARGPLHGIPVLIKDNIDTADRMHTSAGSLALAGSIAPRDSFVAERLRAAGAVILGKANLSEWANIRSTHSSSGWSGRGGQCHNPYALDRSPSGSSSGSAAAVAANLCAIAVGTETDGSITSPGATCGIVGIKPTVGLVSRSGIIPISHTQDTAGPLTRTVADAAALLSALAGRDPRDPATRGSAAHGADYTRFLDAGALKGLRLGVARKRYTGYNPAVDALFEDALRVLRDAGAVIVDPADLTTEDHLGGAEQEVLLTEFKADLRAYLAALGPGAPVSTLADVIAFDGQNRAREMPFFAQELFEQAQKKGPTTSPAYRTALARCRRYARKEGIDAVMARHRLGAIICPTQAPAWLTDYVNGDAVAGNCTTPAAVAGYPHVTVPMGQVSGLPVGLSFFGRAWSEATLIKAAFAYEQASRMRRVPQFLPSAVVPGAA